MAAIVQLLQPAFLQYEGRHSFPSMRLLETKLPLDFSPPLLPLHLLADFLCLLSSTLLALLALPLLVQRPALHDARHNFCRIDVLVLVVRNFAVDVERLGDGVWVVGQRHEFCNAMVDGQGGAVGEREQECFGQGEWGAENCGVDVLL